MTMDTPAPGGTHHGQSRVLAVHGPGWPASQPGGDRSDSQADGATSILITRSTHVIAGGSRPLRGPVSLFHPASAHSADNARSALRVLSSPGALPRSATR
jgi:hypothetical protein